MLSTLLIGSTFLQSVNRKQFVALQSLATFLTMCGLLLTVGVFIMPTWSVAALGRTKRVQIGLWSICKSTERSTDCALWNSLQIWNLAKTNEPDYVRYSRVFLQFSILSGLVGNIFALVGNGLLCCTRKFKTTVIIQAVASLSLSASAMLVGASGTVFPILFKAPTADINQRQINHVLTRDYFSVDPRSRPIFEHGIALYLCWAAMIIYGTTDLEI